MTPGMNPPLGSPPTLEWIAVGKIGVDPGYQRGTDNEASQGLIRKIARFWDWSLCQPLSCTRRADGSVFAVDGQHRRAAALARGDIAHLPCVIARYDSPADEAAAFVALNKQRKPLTAIDLFRAALAAGDEEAAHVAGLMQRAGLSLAPHTNYTTWKPGMIASIPSVVRAVRRRGAAVALAAMGALASAYPAEKLRFAGLLLEGLFDVYSSTTATAPGFDGDLFVSVVRVLPQAGWITEARKVQASTGMSRAQSQAKAMLDAYRAAVARRAIPAAPRPAAPAVAARRQPDRTPSPEPITAGSDAFDKRVAGHPWCDQCDRQVSLTAATLCRSAFCKVRPKMATRG